METNLNNKVVQTLANSRGAIGYIFAWALGVPASVLLVIFLLRGG